MYNFSATRQKFAVPVNQNLRKCLVIFDSTFAEEKFVKNHFLVVKIPSLKRSSSFNKNFNGLGKSLKSFLENCNNVLAPVFVDCGKYLNFT